MSTYIKQKKQTPTNTILHKFLLVLGTIIMLVVFLKPELSNVCGPILTIIFTLLYFLGHQEFVFAAIITANDALGTMFMGKLSFQYLLLVLAILKILQDIALSKRRWVFLFVSAYFLIQLLLVESISNKGFVNTLSYTVAIVAMCIDADDKTISRFFESVAIIIVLISIHAILTGGVEYYEFNEYKDSTSEHFLRRGILSAGSSNPNQSAFLLNIGIIAIWHFASCNFIIKLLCTIPVLYAFILTNSLSGLLALTLITTLSILMKQNRDSKRGKHIFIACIVILVLIVLLNAYANLPSALRIEQLDHYIERIENRIDFVKIGDWQHATTNRSDLAAKYIRYVFLGQSAFGMLFGGNPMIVPNVSSAVPHNTYVSLLLQVGVLGTLIFLVAVFKRMLYVWKQQDMPYRKGRLLMKILCLFVSFGMSLYSSSLWSFWMMGLLLL